MKKQNVFALLLLTIVLLAVVSVSGCIGGSDDDSANDASGDSDDSSPGRSQCPFPAPDFHSSRILSEAVHRHRKKAD